MLLALVVYDKAIRYLAMVRNEGSRSLSAVTWIMGNKTNMGPSRKSTQLLAQLRMLASPYHRLVFR